MLSYIESESYPTISSVSKTFKMHKMAASWYLKKMEKEGLVSIERAGSAKIIKVAKK